MTSLAGKNAVVTGSTSGIGLGIATQLAKAGASIIINGFASDEAIADITAQIGNQGVTCQFIHADLSKPAEANNLIVGATEALGSVDILVNNAGIQHVDKIENFPDEKWDALIAINLSAAFHTIKTAVPGMKQSGYGRIINIASAHGLVASANKAGYVAAKHGIVGLSKVVAQETVDYNITCNAICPGWVDTPLVREQIEKRAQSSGKSTDEEARLLLTEKQPKPAFTTPDDIGRMAVYLCDEANQTITGAALSIDGGWTSQ